VILVVIDGMGGHEEGDSAAETEMATLMRHSGRLRIRFSIRLGFLKLAPVGARGKWGKLGVGLGVESRPRATMRVVCLVSWTRTRIGLT